MTLSRLELRPSRGARCRRHSERPLGVTAVASRRKPDPQRRRPIPEPGRYAGPHAVHSAVGRVDRYARSRISGVRVQFRSTATNHIGSYPVHIHRLLGPRNPSNTGYQFRGGKRNQRQPEVADSYPWKSLRPHQAERRVRRRQLTGSGIASKTARKPRTCSRRIRRQHPRQHQSETKRTQHGGRHLGRIGRGVLLANGFNNRFVNNVAASCRNPVQQIVSEGRVHRSRRSVYGANPLYPWRGHDGQAQTVSVIPQHQPIIEFRGNEVYGLAADGSPRGNLARWIRHGAVERWART